MDKEKEIIYKKELEEQKEIVISIWRRN